MRVRVELGNVVPEIVLAGIAEQAEEEDYVPAVALSRMIRELAVHDRVFDPRAILLYDTVDMEG